MFNKLFMYRFHIKNSKNTLFLSTIGLIFALSILSSSLQFVNTAKGDIIEEMFKTPNASPYEVEIRLITPNVKVDYGQIYTEIRDLGKEMMDETGLNFFQELELYKSIEGLFLSMEDISYSSFYDYYGQETVNKSLMIVELTENIKKELQSLINENSTLPKDEAQITEVFFLETLFGNEGETLLQLKEDLNSIGYEKPKVIEIFASNTNKTNKYQVNVTGYGKIVNHNQYDEYWSRWKTNYNEELYPTLSKFWRLSMGGVLAFNFPILFVTNITDFAKNLQPLDEQSQIYGVKAILKGGYKINFDRFDPFTVSSKIAEINRLQTSIKDKIFDSNFYKTFNVFGSSASVNFVDYGKFNDIVNVIVTIIFEMLLYSFPLIILAIFITNYSYGLIHKNVLRRLGVYKTRGMAGGTIFLLECLDFIVITIIATLGGLVLGIPVTMLITKTDFLLSFNNIKNYDVLTNFLVLYPYLLVALYFVAVLLSLIINLRRMIKLSSITVFETENVEEKDEPAWKRHNLDIIFFFYGTISFFVIANISPSTAGYNIFIGLLLLLTIPSPFAVIIGAILICNRIIPVILNRIGSVLWLRTGNLFAFSFKNVIRHRQASTRAIMLIATLMTFLILFYSAPYSNMNHEIRTSLFNNGGEGKIKISSMGRDLQSIKGIIKEISTILTNNYSESLEYSSYAKSAIFDKRGDTYSILFINSTTYEQGSSAKQFSLGLKNDLTTDLQKLRENNSNNIILGEQWYYNVKPKLNSTLYIQGMDKQEAEKFTVIDTCGIWPIINTFGQQENQDRDYYYGKKVIMDLKYLINDETEEFSQTIVSEVYEIGFTINFKPGIDRQKIASAIRGQTNLDIQLTKYAESFSYDNWKTEDRLVFRFVLTQININVVMSLIIAVIILVMFAYLQMNERKREIFTERALGMKTQQTAMLFFIESIIIVITSIIIGTLLGQYFVEMLSLYMRRGITGLNYEIIIPWHLVGLTYILLGATSVISSIIPAYIVYKQDISKSFIADY